MSQWTGVILAAGQGTRMRSDLPKALHQVCGTTLLGHVSRVMKAAGAHRIVLVVSPGGSFCFQDCGREPALT